MIGRKKLRNIWVGALLVFFIFSMAYAYYPSIGLSPGSSNDDLGRLLFAGFVVLLLLVLLLVMVIPYFMHELES